MNDDRLDAFERKCVALDSIDSGVDWFEAFTKGEKPIYQEIKESDSYINREIAKELLEQ
jgi:hypothetical protein